MMVPYRHTDCSGPYPFMSEGRGLGGAGTSLCGQGTASQKLETLLYHQAKDGWKCHIQPNLGKPKS